jgi:hypothetical protein
MKQPTTVGRNVSWPYIATGGLQVMVFRTDISPSAAAQNESETKNYWSDILFIDI